MAHLLPNPPPANHRDSRITNFAIGTPSGVGELLAWGADAQGATWRVGTKDPLQVRSEEQKSEYPDLKFFKLGGVKANYELALFINRGQGWDKYSDFVTCTSNSAQFAVYPSSGLPRSRFNKNLIFYPFGSQHACQAIPEDKFVEKIEWALGTLCENVIGRTVVQAISSDLFIYPFLPCDPDSNSSLMINPAQWESNFKPGAGLDEVLLHELIHVLEGRTGDYKDRYGFAFDKTDFLTVNATNVYSCMRGRALRKDHLEFLFLPSEHFKDPKLHFTQQEPNYKLAEGSAVDLVKALRGVRGVWNPFQYLG